MYVPTTTTYYRGAGELNWNWNWNPYKRRGESSKLDSTSTPGRRQKGPELSEFIELRVQYNQNYIDDEHEHVSLFFSPVLLKPYLSFWET
jgi:hypothetical protein